MARKLQFKRGNKAQMPVLDVGEPAFATDEGKLYLGSSTGNIALARGDHTHRDIAGLAYGICSTAAGTVEKTVSVNGFSLSPGAMVFVRFLYGVPAGGTLHVGNTGAKPIYWREKVIGSDGILAGDGCELVYTGSVWDLIAIDRLAGTGGAQSVSFSADSWETIQKFCAAGAHRNVYARGDTKTIALSTGENITVRIEDFDHDDLESGGKAPLTLMMGDCLSTTHRMNATNTNVGGWDSSELRSWMSGTLLGQLPSDLQGIIQPVKKLTSAGNGTATLVTTVDKLWLPSYTEIGCPHNASYSPGGEGSAYPLFSSNPSARVKRCNGSADYWWLRSPYAINSSRFDSVDRNGKCTNSGASYATAVSVGFCM